MRLATDGSQFRLAVPRHRLNSSMCRQDGMGQLPRSSQGWALDTQPVLQADSWTQILLPVVHSAPEAKAYSASSLLAQGKSWDSRSDRTCSREIVRAGCLAS
jgi:hypothetical protein